MATLETSLGANYDSRTDRQKKPKKKSVDHFRELFYTILDYLRKLSQAIFDTTQGSNNNKISFYLTIIRQVMWLKL